GHDGDKLCAAFSPDGKLLATGEGDHDRPGTVRLWDAVTSEQLASLTRQTGRVESVAFSPDGKLLAGTIGDEVKVWDVKTQHVRAMRQGRGPVAFSPDGKLLAVTARDTLSVILWDLEKSVTLMTFKAHDKPIHGLAFHPNGRTLATGSEDWSVRLWN